MFVDDFNWIKNYATRPSWNCFKACHRKLYF